MSKIWVRMFTTKIYLLRFKIQSHLQIRGLCRYVRPHPEEKPSKTSNITFAILHFSHQNTLTKSPSWVFWSLLFYETIRCASKFFILTQRKQMLEFVNLKWVTYTQSIRLSSLFASEVIAAYSDNWITLYCCYAPVLHWVCVVIVSIEVQDREGMIREDYNITLRLRK